VWPAWSSRGADTGLTQPRRSGGESKRDNLLVLDAVPFGKGAPWAPSIEGVTDPHKTRINKSGAWDLSHLVVLNQQDKHTSFGVRQRTFVHSCSSRITGMPVTRDGGGGACYKAIGRVGGSVNYTPGIDLSVGAGSG
jgi:hypothetical protein